jgi:cellulose synthase/poly-beta-1,6-N-acetylglucosamine synthase-like glycosyltransferase
VLTLLAIASTMVAVVAVPSAAYLGALALLASPRPPPPAPARPRRFVIIVPAHDEAASIAATVTSLLGLRWPRELFAVLVIADNCSDDTAARARAAGAVVLERTDRERRGKGYALELAFGHLLAGGCGPFDAAVVVDADTVVTPNLLEAFSARLGRGDAAIQADYEVRNPDESWRTRLMALAFALFHRTRSLGRERLGLSVGLRGNGMCFSRELLRDHPCRAYGLTEDVEYGLDLGLVGVRVAFVHEAEVRGEMVSRGDASVSQRRRWEEGRRALLRDRLPGLVAAAVRRHSAVLADLAVDLLVPPLATVGLSLAAGCMLEAALLLAGGAPGPRTWAWVAAVVLFAAYMVRGIQASGLGWRAVEALLVAPAYAAWKLFVARPFGRGGAWVRTARRGEAAPGGQGADDTGEPRVHS